MAPLLQGRWALVTGTSSGIGRSIALTFAKEGASLILTARREELLKVVAKEALAAGAPRVETVVSDLATPAGVEALAAATLSIVKGSDLLLGVLVNNSGVLKSGFQNAALQGDPDEWDAMISLNVSAPMRLTRRLAPTMVEQGSGAIINIASFMATEAIAHFAAYSATKWAVRGWSKCLHQDLSSKGIKVVAIHPGLVATEMTAPMIASGMRKASEFITPEDIAEAVLLGLRLSPAATPEEIVVKNMTPTS